LTRDPVTKKLDPKCTRSWAAGVLAAKGIGRDVPLWVLRGLVGQFKVPVEDVVNQKPAVLEAKLKAYRKIQIRRRRLMMKMLHGARTVQMTND
jgi:hypothetical protein